MFKQAPVGILRSFVAVAALGLIGTAARAGDPELVQNGGFETGDFTAWTATPSQGATLFGVDGGGPHNGDFSAYFGGLIPYDVISQTLATTAGSHYIVSFYLDSEFTSPAPAGFVGSFGGTTFVSLSGADPDVSFQPFVFDVVATAASTLLSFSAYNTGFFYTLDDVSVQASSVTSPVPEPETLALMLAGLAGVGAVARRRRRA